jgi:hypothetical protein
MQKCSEASSALLLWNDRGTLIAGCGGFPIVARAAASARLPLCSLVRLKEKSAPAAHPPPGQLSLRESGHATSWPVVAA